MKRFLRDNGLTVVLVGMFLVFLGGHSVAGHRVYNEDQRAHHESTVSYAKYLSTGAFGESVFENWESEFLQMGAYILLTVRLRQRGSAESKKVDGDEAVDEDPAQHHDDANAPSAVRRGGMWLAVYRHSLSLAFAVLFLGSIAGHAITGAHAYSAEQEAHGEPAVTTASYVTRSQFWFESLQNWQSEFLAVGAIVWLSIYLREQGSPESKPVHAPHSQTGSD
jgi:hypothetical protein